MIQGIERRTDAFKSARRAIPSGRARAGRRAVAAIIVIGGAAAVALWPTPAALYTPGADTPVVADASKAAPDIRLPAGAPPTQAAIPPAANIKPAPAAMPTTVMLMPGAALPRPADDAAPGISLPDADRSRTETERERAMARELAALRQQIAAQRAKLAALHSAKAPMLKILDKQSREGVARAEKVVALTGLDLDKLLGESAARAKRPTVIGVWGFPLSNVDGFDSTARTVAARVERWRRLQGVLERLPLIAPLDHYRKTSEFGKRSDPMTHRTRKHNGTDFAYYRGAPVRATAAGTVVFAGRRGGFGNLIEIDHGRGIRTRYAHMHKVMVEKGDTVLFRQQIGLLGTTGRSTGPHVHYEILVRGRAVDPMRFVTAGKYAFKPVPEAEIVAVKPEDEKRDGEAFRTAGKAKVDLKPKPRAAASMADRPDSSTLRDSAIWPGIAAHVGRTAPPTAAPTVALAPAPKPASRTADLSESLIHAAGILPSLRPRKRLRVKRHKRHRRRWRAR